MIYNTIEDQIVPLYYDRGQDGIPHGWVNSVKNCISDIASNFTTNRMLIDSENRFYNKLAARKSQMVADNYRAWRARSRHGSARCRRRGTT